MKEKIREELRRLIEQKGSINKAAASLEGVSAATISLIMTGKGSEVREKMWRHLAEVLDTDKAEWKQGETMLSQMMERVLGDAQQHRLVMSLTAPAGSGKSFSAKMYERNNREVYRLGCNEFWTKNDFVDELLRVLGESGVGYSKKERMSMAITAVKRKERPLIIFDEFDKLNDNVWFFFITLYNELEDKCGMILLSTDSIEVRIKRGLRLNKRGYNELWSRLGRRCVALEKIGWEDVEKVCKANGVDNASQIEDIYEGCEGDLRRVKRMVFAAKRK